MIFFRDFPKKWEIYLKLKKNEKEKKKRLKRFDKKKKKYYWNKKDTPVRYTSKKWRMFPKKSHTWLYSLSYWRWQRTWNLGPLQMQFFCKHMRTRPQVWCADFFFSSPECGVYEAILLGFTGKEILNPLPPTLLVGFGMWEELRICCKSILKMHLKNLRL